MIIFNERKINVSARNFPATTDSENLNALAEEGLVEKREDN